MTTAGVFSFSTRIGPAHNDSFFFEDVRLSAIVRHILGSPATDFVVDFLAMFRALYSPCQLLETFFLCLEKANREEREEKFRSFRELMCQWLLVYWKDFEEEENDAEKRLSQFLDRFECESDVEEEAKKIRVFMETARQYSQSMLGGKQEAILQTIIPKMSPCPLRKIHPEEVARQITIVQWQVFSKLNLVRAIPFTGSTSTGSPNVNTRTGPSTPTSNSFPISIVQVSDDLSPLNGWAPFGDWTNLGGHLQRWAATCVCIVPKPTLRVKTLQHLIEVAYYLHKLGNYEGCYRILEGLQLLPLPSTWAGLPQKLRNVYSSLNNSMRALFLDPARLTEPNHPHLPLIEAFTHALQQIAQTQSRFMAEPPNAIKRRWMSTSQSAKDLKYSDKPKEKDQPEGASSLIPTSSSNPFLETPPTMPTSPTVTITNTVADGPQLNLTRAHSEAVLLTKLKSYQSKSFPFTPVPWMTDLVTRTNPLSVWTIQEYCETLEPTKYTSPTPTHRGRTSPRHIASSRSAGPVSILGVGSGGTSPPRGIGIEISPPASPRGFTSSPRRMGGLDSAESSPREYELSPTLGGGLWTEVSASSSSSPNASPPNLGTALLSSQQVSLGGQHGYHASFSHRKAIHRPASSVEMELDRLGFFVYSVPPLQDSGSAESPRAQLPTWWSLLDDDRLEDVDDEIFSQLLLEYLPCPEWSSLFALNPIKAVFFNMRTSKLASKFKQAAKMRWRKDFCFAAPSHSKGVKLNTYRLVNTEAQQYVPATYTVVLTNSSSAIIEWEVASASPLSSSPHLTKSEIFVAFSPSSGSLGPGKSISLKITAVLLEEVQFYKFFRISVFWPDLLYAAFVPLFIAQACPSHAPSTVAIKELSASIASQASDENKRKLPTPRLPKSLTSSHDSQRALNPDSTSSTSSTSNPILSPRPKDAFWKIPLEDLKSLKRLGGTQASVSLCSLYGAEVVLKKWDIGTLDPAPDEFLLELEALRSLRHPNLVQFLGAQSGKGVAFLVTEYAPKGALSELLQAGDFRKRNARLPISRFPTILAQPVNRANLYQNQSPPHLRPSNKSSGMVSTSLDSTAPIASLNTSPPNDSGSILAASISGSSSGAAAGTGGNILKRLSVRALGLGSPRSSGDSPIQSLHASSTTSTGQMTPSSSSGAIMASGNPKLAWTPSTTYSSTSMKLKLTIAADIASAMAYMHYHSHMHRDLKSLNILVDEAWHGKVADLGSSKNWANARQMTAGVGSFDWIAPEVLNSQSYSVAADVFSFGLILWELVQERFPERPMDMVAKGYIPTLDHDKITLLFRDASSPIALEYINLVKRCCDIDPLQRPSFADIVIVLEQMLSSVKNSARHPTPTATPRLSKTGHASSLGASTATTTPSEGTTSKTNSPTAQTPSPPNASNPLGLSSLPSISAIDSVSETKRSGSGDAWVRALKASASNSTSLYLQQLLSPASSPASSAPITPHDLSPTMLSPHGSPEETNKDFSNASSKPTPSDDPENITF